VSISAVAVTLVLGTIIPVLVGLITKMDASSKLKGALMIVLNAVQGLVVASQTASGDAVFSVDALILFAAGVAMSLAAYYGLYKPNDVPEKLAPTFGIGGSGSTETPPSA
jgi:hypothetical protein